MKRLLLALALGITTTNAAAQAWPAKPIRWIIPFPPGGSTDIATRPVVDRLSQVLGQAIVIENRAGASGNIGIEAAAKSPADGYTVLSSIDSMMLVPHLFPKLGFDPLRDFEPVTQLARQPVLLAVHPSLGVASIAELVALAKTKPGIPFATSGAGTQQHVVAEWFAKLTGIQLTHVPYRGGGQAISDLVGGQIQLASLGSSPLMPHYRSGKLRVIAQSSAKRSPSLPDVPTYQEAGVQGLALDQWLGVYVPRGTPREIIDRLGNEVRKALADATIRERYAAAALEPVGNSAQEFGRFGRSEFEKYGRLVKELAIKAE